MRDIKTFKNPVPFRDGKRHTNPDPYVLRWCGRYYCYATDEFGVKVSVSENLVDWEDCGYAIREAGFRNYWAPAVIYINGIFYMYYSNVPSGETDCHEEYLKLAVSHHPLYGFQHQKTFFDKFSIDAHPFFWNEKLYLFYSVNDWVGTDEKKAGTCILLDEMISPEQFAGKPQAVILPGLKQEIYAENRFGDGRDWYTIEGAAPVIRGSRFWLLYSANAYVNEDYYIGTALAMSKPDIREMVWKKYPQEDICYPLLRKNQQVEGTGHNTVVKAPNLVDEWIVYHARNAEETLCPEIEQREMYLDPLYFDGDRLFTTGPSALRQENPGIPQVSFMDKIIDKKMILCEAKPFYKMEFWISAKKSHVGARYGILLNYLDEGNYLELELHSGRQELRIICCLNHVITVIAAQRPKTWFNYMVPHVIEVTRSFEQYQILFGHDTMLCFEYSSQQQNGSIGAIPYFTKLTLHSFKFTETVLMDHEKLKDMGRIFHMSPSIADVNGLVGRSGEISFRHKEETGESRDFTEIYLFGIAEADNQVELETENGKEELTHGKKDSFSLYHIVRAGEAYFWIGGNTKHDTKSVSKSKKCDDNYNYKLRLKGLRVLEYQYTKNG